MAVRPEVLCLSADPVLNRTRRLVLLPWFEVCVASSLEEAASWMQERRFRVIILCHTLSPDDGRAALELAHTLNPDARILSLEEGNPRLSVRSPHQEVRLDGPADLLRHVASMAGVPLPEPGPSSEATAPTKPPSAAD